MNDLAAEPDYFAQPRVFTPEDGVCEVSPAYADFILDAAAYDRQRVLRERQVNLLLSIMRAGAFDDDRQIIFARLADRSFLIDGQHRLRALARFDRPIRFTFKVYACASFVEVAEHYGRIDFAAQGRDVRDFVRTYDLAAEHDLDVREACVVATAGKVIAAGLAAAPQATAAYQTLRSPDALADFLVPWWPSARLYLGAISPGAPAVRRCLYRSGVAAVGLLTARWQPDRARDFWTGLARDDGLRQHDPRKTLLAWFGAHRAIDGKLGVANDLRAAAQAWNAAWHGRPLQIIRAQRDLSFELAGTPVRVETRASKAKRGRPVKRP